MTSIKIRGLLLTALWAAGCSMTKAPDNGVATTSGGAAPTQPARGSLAIRAGKLINPRTQTILSSAVLVIDQGRFTYVGTNPAMIPPSAKVLDWSQWTALPGLIDAHTHIGFMADVVSPKQTPWQRLGELTDDQVLVLSRRAALAALRRGVTTMVDKGNDRGIDLILRGEIAAGTTRGPRLFVAGQGINPIGNPTIPSIEQEIQRQARQGTDLVKVWADICSDKTLECKGLYKLPELQAVVKAAHAYGKRVAVHAYHAEVAALAIEAGADTLEHAEGLDAATLQKMKARGMVYVPTIDHNRYYKENAAWFKHEFAVPEFDAYIAKNITTAKAALKAGVHIAMGSDAVFTMFGQNTNELSWLVGLGMTPMAALEAGTYESARSIGKEKELGMVELGSIADVIAVQGDPLVNIDVAIHQVREVVKDGKLVDLN